jgi:hypothetical protein
MKRKTNERLRENQKITPRECLPTYRNMESARAENHSPRD